MRQTDSSPSALARRKAASRVSEFSRFAARINRAMKVDIEQEIVIVTPSDDLGTLRYQEIHLEVGRISDVLRHGGFQRLLIDLGERRRLENVILTALVGFCRAIPGIAAFCCVSDEIQQSMRTVNLLRLWPLYASRSEAIEAMSAPDSNRPAHRDGGLDA